MALGGANAPATIEVRDGQLVAVGTEEQHQALGNLIAQLKQQRSVQINVEARLLDLTDRALQSLPDELRAKIAQASIAPRPLSAENYAQLMQVIREGAHGSSALTAPNLTLFNQQRAFVQVSTNQSYIADFLKDEQGELKPVGGNVWSGVHMDVRAAASVDGRTVGPGRRHNTARAWLRRSSD